LSVSAVSQSVERGAWIAKEKSYRFPHET